MFRQELPGPKSLLHVIESLDFTLLDAKSDPIGDAFEVFAGSESRARAGQFFTPYNVMDVLVKMVDPKPGETVIDPACGAGGFLASVVRHHRASGYDEQELAANVSSFYGIEKDAYLAKLARLHVSLLTCLITLTKFADNLNDHPCAKVFMAEAKWCGKDSRAREIPHDDLPTIAEIFATFKCRKKLVASRLGFIIEDKKLEASRVRR